MKNKQLYDAIFNLMQEANDILGSINKIKEISLDYDNIDLNKINQEDERFYNLLLIFLRNCSDNLWLSNEHRLQVYDVIKEQLDAYSNKPDPFIKSKSYV